MTIDSFTAPTSPDPSSPSARAKARSDFQALASDLQTGDLANAQSDFATLLQDAPQLQNKLQAAPSGSPTSAFSALSSALQAGDLNGAQAAMTSLKQSVQGFHHHHHHHHFDNDQDNAGQLAGAGGATTAGAGSAPSDLSTQTTGVTL